MSLALSPMVYIKVLTCRSSDFVASLDASRNLSNRRIHLGQSSGFENLNCSGGVIIKEAIICSLLTPCTSYESQSIANNNHNISTKTIAHAYNYNLVY